MRKFISKLAVFLILSMLYQQAVFSSGEDRLTEGGGVQTEFGFLSFSVFVRENAAVILYKTNTENSELVLFRSTEPFESAASLINAVPVANIKDNGLPFIDFPLPGIPYYYAILEENGIAFGNINFVNGKNTFNKPIEIIDSEAEKNSKFKTAPRSMPLPYLNPEQKGKIKPEYFSSSTENIISEVSAEKDIYGKYARPQDKRSIRILPEEETSPVGGEALALQEIIENYFKTRNWQKCEAELNTFLSLRRTERVSGRARFYLGQTYFFTGRYRKALMEFLCTKDIYPNPSQEWIRYCLPELQDTAGQLKQYDTD